MTWAELKSEIEKMTPTAQRQQAHHSYPYGPGKKRCIPVRGIWTPNKKAAKKVESFDEDYYYLF
jgi:hypothetical protein